MTDAPTPQDLLIEALDGAAIPATLMETFTPDQVMVWSVERELWAPRTITAFDASGSPVGAALTAARPLSAYRKIVDIVAINDEVWATLAAAARDDAAPNTDGSRPAPIAVHFEEHLPFAELTPARRAALAEAGFVPVATPVPSIPSTRAGDSTLVAGWSYWRGDAPSHAAPYYGQTTDVTCGAVASLMALEQRGNHTFSTESFDDNRAAEIAFWRRATNLPACEPVGLAVETAKLGRDSGSLPALPRVILSTPDPVLIEEFATSDWDRQLRTDLQLESLRQAEELGLPIERRWIDVAEIAEIVRGGDQVLLLIDLTELIADPTPHWVLATDVIGEALVISDPWVQAPNGETWVDTFALPLPFATVDRVTRWGDPAYRGVIVLPA